MDSQINSASVRPAVAIGRDLTASNHHDANVPKSTARDQSSVRKLRYIIGAAVVATAVVIAVFIYNAKPTTSNALQAENDRLKARLAGLESSVVRQQAASDAGITNSRSDSATAGDKKSFDSPHSVVMAYLAAPVWQDRIRLVVTPLQVRPLMEQAYETVTLIGKQTVKLDPDNWTKGKIQAPKLQADGKFFVAVDMSGVDADPIWEYLVVKEADGFKIDWVASRDLAMRRSNAILLTKWGLANAVLKVKVLQIKQSSNYTKMTLQATNDSEAFLSFVGVSAAVYDANGDFLANDSTNSSNLRPHESFIKDLLIGNVQASKISSWKISLGSMTAQKETGERLPDTQKHFQLQETK